MATVFTSNLRLALPTNGTEMGTWGNTVNNGITSLLDSAVSGTTTIVMTAANYTLSSANGAADESRSMFINVTGTPGAARNVICPAVSKLYFVTNNTTGGYAQTFKTASGTGISVESGVSKALYCDGTNVLEAISGSGITGQTNTWTASQIFEGSWFKIKGSSTGVTAFISGNASATNYVITVPAVTATLATIAATETLTNKTILAATNNVEARSLKSASTTVSVSAATAPAAGQVLTAINSTSASWQTPASGSYVLAIPIAASDETTALTTGSAKVTFRMPYAMTLTAVRASLTTAQTSGSIFTVDINEGGTTILSTKITIDNTETTSTTAATPPVISDTALADDAVITIDIDQIGDGTAAGLKVYLIGVPG